METLSGRHGLRESISFFLPGCSYDANYYSFEIVIYYTDIDIYHQSTKDISTYRSFHMDVHGVHQHHIQTCSHLERSSYLCQRQPLSNSKVSVTKHFCG